MRLRTAALTTEQGAEPAADNRRRYAKLDCPEAVAPDNGLTWWSACRQNRLPGVAGGSMQVPASVGDHYDVNIQLVADGFRTHADDATQLTLQVTPQDRFPVATLRLAALGRRAI